MQFPTNPHADCDQYTGFWEIHIQCMKSKYSFWLFSMQLLKNLDEPSDKLVCSFWQIHIHLMTNPYWHSYKSTYCFWKIHMVRNHHDGYPYLNLSLFFLFLFLSRNLIFFWKKLLVNEFRTTKGGVLLGIFKKNIILIFETLQKMVTKLGQFTKPGPFSTFQLLKLSQLCYHFL